MAKTEKVEAVPAKTGTSGGSGAASLRPDPKAEKPAMSDGKAGDAAPGKSFKDHAPQTGGKEPATSGAPQNGGDAVSQAPGSGPAAPAPGGTGGKAAPSGPSFGSGGGAVPPATVAAPRTSPTEAGGTAPGGRTAPVSPGSGSPSEANAPSPVDRFRQAAGGTFRTELTSPGPAPGTAPDAAPGQPRGTASPAPEQQPGKPPADDKWGPFSVPHSVADWISAPSEWTSNGLNWVSGKVDQGEKWAAGKVDEASNWAKGKVDATFTGEGSKGVRTMLNGAIEVGEQIGKYQTGAGGLVKGAIGIADLAQRAVSLPFSPNRQSELRGAIAPVVSGMAEFGKGLVSDPGKAMADRFMHRDALGQIETGMVKGGSEHFTTAYRDGNLSGAIGDTVAQAAAPLPGAQAAGLFGKGGKTLAEGGEAAGAAGRTGEGLAGTAAEDGAAGLRRGPPSTPAPGERGSPGAPLEAKDISMPDGWNAGPAPHTEGTPRAEVAGVGPAPAQGQLPPGEVGAITRGGKALTAAAPGRTPATAMGTSQDALKGDFKPVNASDYPGEVGYLAGGRKFPEEVPKSEMEAGYARPTLFSPPPDAAYATNLKYRGPVGQLWSRFRGWSEGRDAAFFNNPARDAVVGGGRYNCAQAGLTEARRFAGNIPASPAPFAPSGSPKRAILASAARDFPMVPTKDAISRMKGKSLSDFKGVLSWNEGGSIRTVEADGMGLFDEMNREISTWRLPDKVWAARFDQVSAASLEEELRDIGPGANMIVTGTMPGGPFGHVVNVQNRGGEIYVLDTQFGDRLAYENLERLQFMKRYLYRPFE